MYSRKTGMLYNSSTAQQKIESFNNELREQYRQHKSKETVSAEAKSVSKEEAPSNTIGLPDAFSNDDLIIIGLILLLMSEQNKDYLVIGLLAMLLLLNH